MAARLCQAAAGGEILASDRVVGLTGPVDGAHWGRPRETRVRGVSEPLRVVRVEPDEPLPAPPPRPTQPGPPRRRRAIAAAAAVAALALATGIGLYLIGRGGVATPPRSLAVIDPASGRLLRDVPLPGVPESVAAAFGRIWIGQAYGSVSAVTMRGMRLTAPVGVGIDPQYVAAGDGGVWVFDGESKLVELSPSSTSPGVTGRRTLWRCTVNHFLHPGVPGCGGGGLAVVDREIWVGQAPDGFTDSRNGLIVRIRPSDLRAVGNIPHVAIGSMAFGEGALWSFGAVGMEVDRVDAVTREVIHIPLRGQIATFTPTGVAVRFGAAYAPSPAGTLYRCTAGGDAPPTCRTLPAPPGLTDVAASPTALWATTDSGLLLEINPFTGAIEHRREFGRVNAVALAYADRRVWVALAPQ